MSPYPYDETTRASEAMVAWMRKVLQENRDRLNTLERERQQRDQQTA